MKKNHEIEELEKKAIEDQQKEHFPALMAKLFEKKKRREGVKEIIYLHKSKRESFAYWCQKTTSIKEVIEEFGGFDCLYITPTDTGAIKINLSAQSPIPFAMWSQIIEQILAANGIGIRRISPCVKELYRTRIDATQIEIFSDDVNKLKKFEGAKVAFQRLSYDYNGELYNSYYFTYRRDLCEHWGYFSRYKRGLISKKEF